MTTLSTAIFAATLSLMPAGAATAGERYFSLIVGSAHIGNDSLNDRTPGFTFGKRIETPWPGVEGHVEAGVFYNSYKEISPIALAGLSTPVGRLGPGEVRLGGSIGTAYYGELSKTLKDEHGVPNLKGMIPIVAATVTWRTPSMEVRLTTVPAADDTDFIGNLSVAVPF